MLNIGKLRYKNWLSHVIINNYFLVAIDVYFSQEAYSVDEYGISVQVVLLFSNPSSFSVTVYVINTDHTATGKCLDIIL